MAKKVFKGKENMDAMVRGLDLAADIVVGTIGPRGRNVFIGNKYSPEITNDGFTIATEIALDDEQEDIGAYAVRNISSQQNDDVGDGTTTVVAIFQAIIHECLKRPESPIQVGDSLKEAGDKALKLLQAKSVAITPEDIKKVALISAEKEDLAQLITEIVQKLGKDAVINVEDSKTFATEYEIMDGYEARVGFVSPVFVNDKKNARTVIEDVPVLVASKKIGNLQDLAVLFKQFDQQNIHKLVLVCEDIADTILGVLALNKEMGKLECVVIRALGDTLTDIAIATGSTVVSDATGVNWQTVTVEHLGKAKKVVVDAHKSLFIADGSMKEVRIADLTAQAENEPNQYIAKALRLRAAQLKGSIAVLKIGAPTDFERIYLKRKAEDAVMATLAALEEGVVEGGGMALWRVAEEVGEETIGEQILTKALEAPLRKILENAGKDYTTIIKNMPQYHGYDAKAGGYTDMIRAGILDPTKVERCALENAVSSASTFITTSAAIVETQDEARNRTGN